eukprot:13609552-Alexandrium_andersonii.AAC.1
MSVLGSPVVLPSNDFYMGSPAAIFATDASVLPPPPAAIAAPAAPALQDVPASSAPPAQDVPAPAPGWQQALAE